MALPKMFRKLFEQMDRIEGKLDTVASEMGVDVGQDDELDPHNLFAELMGVEGMTEEVAVGVMAYLGLEDDEIEAQRVNWNSIIAAKQKAASLAMPQGVTVPGVNEPARPTPESNAMKGMPAGLTVPKPEATTPEATTPQATEFVGAEVEDGFVDDSEATEDESGDESEELTNLEGFNLADEAKDQASVETPRSRRRSRNV